MVPLAGAMVEAITFSPGTNAIRREYEEAGGLIGYATPPVSRRRL
jgi:hypothetical protein